MLHGGREIFGRGVRLLGRSQVLVSANIVGVVMLQAVCPVQLRDVKVVCAIVTSPFAR